MNKQVVRALVAGALVLTTSWACAAQTVLVDGKPIGTLVTWHPGYLTVRSNTGAFFEIYQNGRLRHVPDSSLAVVNGAIYYAKADCQGDAFHELDYEERYPDAAPKLPYIRYDGVNGRTFMVSLVAKAQAVRFESVATMSQGEGTCRNVSFGTKKVGVKLEPNKEDISGVPDSGWNGVITIEAGK